MRARLSCNDGTPAVTYSLYNRRGQLGTVSDATGSHELYYDGHGDLWAEQLPSFHGGRVLCWEVDEFGRREKIGLYNQPDWGKHPQFVQTYAYDAAKGRLERISSWSGGTGYPLWRDSTYEYNASSNLTSWTRNSWAGHDVVRTPESQRDALASINNYKYLSDEDRTVNKLASQFARDELGRVEWHNLDNDWQAPGKNPLARGFVSESNSKIGYQYNARSELIQEDPWYWRNSQWNHGAGVPDNQGQVRWKEFQHDNAGNPTLTHWSGHHYSRHQPNELNQLTSAFGQAPSRQELECRHGP